MSELNIPMSELNNSAIRRIETVRRILDAAIANLDPTGATDRGQVDSPIPADELTPQRIGRATQLALEAEHQLARLEDTLSLLEQSCQPDRNRPSADPTAETPNKRTET